MLFSSPCAEAMNSALLNDVRAHYARPDSHPYPGNPILPELSKYLEAAGRGTALAFYFLFYPLSSLCVYWLSTTCNDSLMTYVVCSLRNCFLFGRHQQQHHEDLHYHGAAREYRRPHVPPRPGRGTADGFGWTVN